MNATRWVTLTEFCKYLGRAGKAHVEDSEKGIFITCVLRPLRRRCSRRTDVLVLLCLPLPPS